MIQFIANLTIHLTQNKTQKAGNLATKNKKIISSTTGISTKRTKMIANSLAYLVAE